MAAMAGVTPDAIPNTGPATTAALPDTQRELLQSCIRHSLSGTLVKGSVALVIANDFPERARAPRGLAQTQHTIQARQRPTKQTAMSRTTSKFTKWLVSFCKGPTVPSQTQTLLRLSIPQGSPSIAARNSAMNAYQA